MKRKSRVGREGEEGGQLEALQKIIQIALRPIHCSLSMWNFVWLHAKLVDYFKLNTPYDPRHYVIIIVKTNRHINKERNTDNPSPPPPHTHTLKHIDK